MRKSLDFCQPRTDRTRVTEVIFRYEKASETDLHLFVPTLEDPANHGSRMKIHLKVSHLLIPRSKAGLSLSLRPFLNQWTVCFFFEFFLISLFILTFLKYPEACQWISWQVKSWQQFVWWGDYEISQSWLPSTTGHLTVHLAQYLLSCYWLLQSRGLSIPHIAHGMPWCRLGRKKSFIPQPYKWWIAYIKWS